MPSTAYLWPRYGRFFRVDGSNETARVFRVPPSVVAFGDANTDMGAVPCNCSYKMYELAEQIHELIVCERLRLTTAGTP